MLRLRVVAILGFVLALSVACGGSRQRVRHQGRGLNYEEVGGDK